MPNELLHDQSLWKFRLLGDPRAVLADGDELRFHRGRPTPWGASHAWHGALNRGAQLVEEVNHQGLYNFAVFSSSATRVSLILMNPETGVEALQIQLDERLNRTGSVWHIEVGGLRSNIRYAWRADGPREPIHRFSPAHNLADPYARAMMRTQRGERVEYHALFPLPDFRWRHPVPIRRPMRDLVIYELHVRGFTMDPSSCVTAPGTYAGLAEKVEYLKDLGINAVELMPVHEFDHDSYLRRSPVSDEILRNFWGYDPIGLLSPNARYSVDGNPLEAINEFRYMVDALHGAGIEVILDVVLNHTGEGSLAGPTLSMRGLDNSVWYMMDGHGNYRDYSGCGNSLNCNHPVVRDFILNCLRYWVTEMGVDGFRFDLAAVLGRDSNGAVLPNPPVLEEIALDPILADVKLIAEAWDARGLYQVGSFPSYGRWAEWNGRFRDDIRRLVRGEAGMIAGAATRLTGSADLYESSGRRPLHSINFVTAHDGFTLADLVCYNQKHNLANGENNRDGANDNYSWNCGIEGPSDDPTINELRQRQQRNMLTLLFLAQGVPMLLAGDEIGRSTRGNNNTWCQDNPLGWINWKDRDTNRVQFEFTRGLIAFRQHHAALRRESFFTDGGEKEISWHGVLPEQPDFGAGSRCLAWRLHGDVLKRRLRREGRINAYRCESSLCWNDLYVAMNFWHQPVTFTPPEVGEGLLWHVVIHTADGTPPLLKTEEGRVPEGAIELPGYCVVVLESFAH